MKCLLLLAILCNCNPVSQSKNDNMEKESDRLILRVIVSYTGAVGYGNVYKCDIIKVIAGNLDEKNITVIILAGDKANATFMDAHLDSIEFEIAFKMKNEMEPYALMPLSGFVDKNKTSWEIEYLKDN